MDTNIVLQIAKIIDKEGAYSIYYNNTGTSKPLPFTTRQKYFQKTYELLSINIIKMLMKIDKDDLKKDLIEWEKEGWKNLGIKIDGMEKIIEAKYE